MSQPTPSPLHLHRIDPSRNMRRFYALSTQPTLFGDTSLIRHWGRIGTAGQEKIETFDKAESAYDKLARLERTKRRRGYSGW